MISFKSYLVLNEFSYNNKDYIGNMALFNIKNIKGFEKEIEKIDGYNIKEPFIFLGPNKIDSVHKILDFRRSDSGHASIYIEFNGKTYEIISAKSNLGTIIKHFKNSKSDTNATTELKEYISLLLFENINRTEEIILRIIKKKKPKIYNLYNKIYYSSAKKQAEELKKYNLKNGSIYERQLDNYSKIIYEAAHKLGAIGNLNNWNPADVWAFSKKGVNALNEISNFETLLELNNFLKSNFDSRDIVGISLKQVIKKASSVVIDPNEDAPTNTDYTFKLDRINIPNNGSYKSIFFITDDNISLKGNMRSKSTTICLNMEMYDHNRGSSLGAVDYKEWNKILKNGSVYTCKNLPDDYEYLLEESYDIFKSYNQNLNTLEEVKGFDDITKKRYVIIASMLNFVMSQNTTNLIKKCYYISQKITKGNSIYLKIY